MTKNLTGIFNRIWIEDDGVLTFEWVLLVTLLTVGIIGGISAARDAIIDELGDVSQAMLNLDQTYTVMSPLVIQVHDTLNQGASNSSFNDSAIYEDCDRFSNNSGQTSGDIIDDGNS